MICSQATKILNKEPAQAPKSYDSMAIASLLTSSEGTTEFHAHFTFLK